MLDRLYTALDVLSSENSVFKIDTIGDAYLVAANLSGDQAHNISTLPPPPHVHTASPFIGYTASPFIGSRHT